MKVVVTNRDQPSHSVQFVVTSAFHIAPDANGDFVYTATGRSLVGDPIANTMVFVTGTWSFSIGPDNELLNVSGNGTMADVCAMID